jgi:hypothetical protein
MKTTARTLPVRSLRSPLLLLATLAGLPAGCTLSSDTPSPGIPEDVRAVVFLQRVARNDGVGNVFDYTSFKAGGRLVKLEPPSADGKLTVLTSDPMFANADIMAWDLSFDAKTIALSARRQGDSTYQLFVMNADGSNPRQITEGPYDYVYPIFIPGQRVMFMASKSVEAGSPQFQDEYERQRTAQVGTVGVDGSGELLGPRNVSHRVAPALLPDGNVLYTEWRHLGDVNDGHLRIMNADMTGMREAFGGEGPGGVANSYLKGRHVETIKNGTGRDTYRIVTVATSRDRTLQSGKLLLVDLGVAEAEAKVTDLTPQVPAGDTPSDNGIGRYYDAEVIGPPGDRKFLASWADGPVESELLTTAQTNANFGLYLLDGRTGRRYPLYDDPTMWEVMARPLKARTDQPPVTATQATPGEKSFVVGALNVYESSVFRNIKPGSVEKVRLLEGFSSEEGFPDMFGLTEFDGQSRYGEVPVYADGSFSAKVPANVPLHMQLVDKFGMSLASEDIWLSGRPGEQRFCGGCHEDRAKNTLVGPGQTEAAVRGPVNLDTPRNTRLSNDFSYEKIRGVPWNMAIQPIFDAKCVSCHDGDATKPGNRQYIVTDMTTGTMQTFTFDLRGQALPLMVGERRGDYDFPASYVSLMGLEMEFGENDVTVQVVGGGPMAQMPSYVRPGSAKDSLLIKKLNPPQRWKTLDPTVRAFPGAAHPADVGGTELTADEYYRIILNIDMGGQYFFRENKAGGAAPTMPPVYPPMP